MKATPLILIALGLAVCFRSNVWNIGAEGQFIVGAIVAGGVALQADADDRPLDRGRAILLAVRVGGMAWAGIVAFLRDRFNANEILVSLMLVYVAEQLLGYLVYGPWKDPAGYNFPQTITFLKPTQIPRLFAGLRVNIGAAHRAGGGGRVLGVPVPHATRASAAGRRPRAGRCALCGLLVAQGAVDARCCCRAAWPGSRAGSRSRARSASSRRTCRRATASPRSSSRSSAGCIRWAWCSRRSS